MVELSDGRQGCHECAFPMVFQDGKSNLFRGFHLSLGTVLQQLQGAVGGNGFLVVLNFSDANLNEPYVNTMGMFFDADGFSQGT